MYASTTKLLHVADVLEKCAAYFQDEEQVETEKRAEHLRTEFLDPIRNSVTDMAPGIQEKLANADPEILGLLKNLSASSGTTDDGSLGGPTEKIASDVSDDPLLAFCMSED